MIWVWVGLLWTDRVRMVLDEYGDRISDVSIFGYRIEPDGLYQTFDKTQLAPYRAKWPHIRWWACVNNNQTQSDIDMFEALRLNTGGARDNLLADLDSILDGNPWLTGIDMDLERGGEEDKKDASNALFLTIADHVHARGKLVSAALPALTATGSVGGENWVDYATLGALLDHFSIMSYDMAWSGSAPGPISPASWMGEVYDWATSQVEPGKLSMGLPCYAYVWDLHDEPTSLYRGVSGTYYAVRNWVDGTWIFDSTATDPAGTLDQPHAGWFAYRDPQTGSPWALTGVYDWWDSIDYIGADGLVFGEWSGKNYAVRYGASSGESYGELADNSVTTQQATYMLQPSLVRDVNGAWAQPRHGYNLTIELLRREPQSATILDDDCRTSATLTQLYAATGSWSPWSAGGDDARPYGQYRVTSSGGSLDAAFTVNDVHIQARFQLPSSGSAGVTIGAIRAELSDAGVLRLTRNGTVVAQTVVVGAGVSSEPGDGQSVVGLRIRGTHARVYSGLYETTMSLRLEADITATDLDGTCGVWASGAAWFDHVRIGDGWWYEPREAVKVATSTWEWIAGRIPRQDVIWDNDHNRFRPTHDVEESETRTTDLSLDWDYAHIHGFPATAYKHRSIQIIPYDVDCWLGRGFLCDSLGALIMHYSDAEYLSRWRDNATYNWGLQGIALWSVGQEDTRVWERFAGGGTPTH